MSPLSVHDSRGNKAIHGKLELGAEPQFENACSINDGPHDEG
jgi:hypothetical protein